MIASAIVKSLLDIEADIAALAARIGAPADALPTYGRSQDGGRPHVEAAAGAYHYVIVERGCELERRTTADHRELLYWVFADATHRMAFDFELRHRLPGQDCRRIAFPRQIELLSKLDPGFGERKAREIAGILRKAPYDDAPFRA